MEHRTCFILMPFSKANDLKKDDLDYIYSHIVKKAIEEFEVDGVRYFQRVERFENTVGSIVTGIVNNLNTADLVVADLTGLNPNVMYELGVRHSLRRGTIIISQDLINLPSDLRDYLTVGYSYSQKTTEQASHYVKFKADITRTINEILTTDKYDSPVLSYLQQKQRFKDEDQVERLVENAIIVEAIKKYCIEIEGMINELLEKDYAEIHARTIYQLFNLKLSNLNNALSELTIPYSTSSLFNRVANSKALIGEVGKLFGIGDYFDALSGVEGFPTGSFGNRDIKSSIEQVIIDVFHLADHGELIGINMFGMFTQGGLLQNQLIIHLEHYIETRAKELGISSDDLKSQLDN